jgi:RHS repeat-associated protein
VDPAKGSLTMTVAGTTVPGDLPIPVVFRYNAAYASEASIVGVWQLVTDPDTGKSYRTYVDGPTGLARGAFATVHFGFVTSGDAELIPYANTSTKPDVYTPRQYFVLEDGTEYSSEDFTPFNATMGDTFTLAQAFGLTSRAASSVLVASSGRLATYAATLADLGSWSTRAKALAPGAEAFTVVLDRDRARIYAPLGANSTWVPILWLDRFGHAVTFAHRLFTTGLPAGIAEIRAVTAVNDRGKGVQLQWATPTAGAAAPAQILTRLDYVGLAAPSLQVTGFSGLARALPSALGGGYARTMLPVAGGPVLQPLEVRLGNPASLAVPGWMGAALPQPNPSGVTGGWPADQVATFTLDGANAELLAFRDFRGVVTSLTWTSTLFCRPDLGIDGSYRSVATASAYDADSSTTLNRTWTWALPTAQGATDWITTATQVWSGPGVVDAAVPTTKFTFAPPSRPEFGNGVPTTTTLLGPQGNVLATVTDEYTQTGVDATLSAVSRQTASMEGGPATATVATLDPASGAILTLQKTSGTYVDLTTYDYGIHKELLEPMRLLKVTNSRTRGGVTLTAPVQTVAYEGTSWYPTKRYLEGGADGQMGATFNYDPASGRLSSTSNFATAPLASTGVATKVFSRDPATGLPTTVAVNFDTPTGTDATVNQWLEYDSVDRPLQTKDASGVTTTFTYDARGRVLTQATTGQATVICAYPHEGTLTVTQNGRQTLEVLDGFGRLLTRQRGADGVTEAHSYDSNGRHVKTVATPTAGTARTTSQSYDAQGRLVRETPPAGPSSVLTYSAAGGDQLVTAVFTGGTTFSTSSRKDLWGNLIASTDPYGAVTTTTFDALGHPLAVTTTPSGGTAQARTFEYTGLGLLKAKTEPETGRSSYSAFNAQGLAQTLTEATGRTRYLQWDGLGRTRRVANGSDYQTFTYAGLLLTSAAMASNGAVNSVIYGHDALGRLNREAATLAGVGLAGWTLDYTYDAVGRLGQLTYPTGRSVTYVYDDTNGYGRVSQVLAGSVKLADVTYDPWGHRQKLTFGSGASNQWDFASDGLQISKQTLNQNGLAAIIRTYGYDGNNHLNQAGEWTTLVHDVTGRLRQGTLSGSAGVPLSTVDGPLTYDYDNYGNNTSALGATGSVFNNFTLAVPPDTNQIPGQTTNSANTGWTYNLNGEALTVSLAIGPNAPQWGLAWNALGRLSSAGYESFTYLPSGLRASRTSAQDWTQNRVYAYTLSGQLLTEYRQTGASPQNLSPRDVVYLGGVAIAELDAGGVHELHCDHLGTPLLSTSQATGRAEGWQYFGPYGEPFPSTGYVPTTGFTGHLQTDATGLIYMRGRFYNPVWHRFLNSDQGADPGQLNQFAYCGGSPMMRTDPSGMADRSAGNGGTFMKLKASPYDSETGFIWYFADLKGDIGSTNFNSVSSGGLWGSSMGQTNCSLGGNVGAGDGSTGQPGQVWGVFGTVMDEPQYGWIDPPQTNQGIPSGYSTIVVPNAEGLVGNRVYGNGTCVALAKAFGAPRAALWMRGPAPDANTPIGTLVATFYANDGTTFANQSGLSHVGAWDGMDGSIITLVDQYRGRSTIDYSYINAGGTRNYNSNANNYFIVLVPRP